MNYKNGDIILIPFPFTNAAANKRRPALVISKETHHQYYNKIICLAITSQAGHNRYEYEILDIKNSGLLFTPSWIQLDKVFTTESQFIIKKLGVLDTGELSDIMKMFDHIIK